MLNHENDTDDGDATDPTESVATGEGRGYGRSPHTADQLPLPPAWAIAPAPPEPSVESGGPDTQPQIAVDEDS
ncbi:hypothetical protein ACFUIY_29200 [Streptomyces griseorubiginosus]|uniref:hypothetical protein n=1 Tax=Streptomyces griseorubiginosus TaxID=67304 RepID=UPI0036418AEF